MRRLLLSLSLVAPLTGSAQFLFEPMTVHPEHIAPGSTFLIKIEDHWTNGCLGDIRTEITADSIAVVAESTPDSAGFACTEALVGFVDLINPRERFDGEFAEQVGLTYTFILPNGEATVRAESTLEFSADRNAATQVETGAWITDQLQNSGLFIDQQGDIFSVDLADYANGSGTWFYGAGRINGDVVVAELSRFAEIRCVTAPCDRSAPAASIDMLAVLESNNSLVVEYEGLLAVQENQANALRYRRLDLARAQAARGVPDLNGQWIIGVGRGDGGIQAADALFTVARRDAGTEGGLQTTRYGARNVNRLDASIEPDFVIDCQDARPVDGGLQCTVDSLPVGNAGCAVFFEWDDAALRSVQGQAFCGELASEFRMLRIDH